MCDHSNREEAMIAVERGPDGTPTVWCDPCLAGLIQTLNDGGVRTIASCCGHGRRPGRVSLADGRQLFILDEAQAAVIDGLWPGINDEPATAEVGLLERPDG